LPHVAGRLPASSTFWGVKSIEPQEDAMHSDHIHAALARERVAHLIGEGRTAGRRGKRRIDDPRTAEPKGGRR
jgi:hypothetical protein